MSYCIDTHHSVQPANHNCDRSRGTMDAREQLVNDGEVGPIEQVSIPEATITRLRAIMLDIDPSLYRGDIAGPAKKRNPAQFYETLIRPMLDRHPVLATAQVRVSGTGLHVILWLTEPIEFASETQRQRWAAITKVIQRLLPTDPDAPGITAMTRPLGSKNAKNGKKVRLLAEGKPISPAAIEALFEEVCASPVKTIMQILFGGERIACPICRKSGATLAAADRVALCYGSCGKVHLSQLFDFFLLARRQRRKA